MFELLMRESNIDGQKKLRAKRDNPLQKKKQNNQQKKKSFK